jgi:hypothetical protein
MPITKNNVKKATKTTGLLIAWIIVIWCLFAVCASLLFIVLANTILKSRFVSQSKNMAGEPMVKNAIDMELKSINITFSFVLLFHLIVGAIIYRKIR